MASDDRWFLTHVDLASSATHADVEAVAGPGLPWTDHNDIWPLSEEQMKLLSFELLVLSQPAPADHTLTHDEPGAPTTSVVRLQNMSVDDRQEFAARLSARLVRQLSSHEAQPQIAALDGGDDATRAALLLPTLLQPPPTFDGAAASVDGQTGASSEAADEDLEPRVSRAVAQFSVGTLEPGLHGSRPM